MIYGKYLYLGGPLDGQWLEPPDVGGRPIPHHYADPNSAAATPDDAVTTYVPTKLAQMGDAGEFRLGCWVMVARAMHAALTKIIVDPNDTAARGYRKRLERALIHQAMRLHMQQIWRVPEVLDFGPAWLAMERRPVEPKTRPIRDNPQA